MAVGAPRRILVGNQPEHHVLALDARRAMTQVEPHAVVHRHGSGIRRVAQALIETFHHRAAQRMIDRHDHLRGLEKAPIRTIFPAPEVSQHGNPVVAVHPPCLLLAVCYDQHFAGPRRALVGQVDRVDEYLGQRAVEPAPDNPEFALGLLRERIAQVVPHDLAAVAQHVVEQAEKQVLDDVVLEPIGQHGEEPHSAPQDFQPQPLEQIQLRCFHGAAQGSTKSLRLSTLVRMRSQRERV